ncbi:hypothetical protein BaRGS_00039208 [Batillaria attramentaria]|uniref:C-type lectin domain-containing protein n=1 Tax=Batillaria attramentaria TaxID=370345 RepID=A0ABD0J4Q3_9CAEN
MLLRLALTAVLTSVFAAVWAECPNGFVRHDSSCYKVFHIKGSWSEAKGYCNIFGAQLASIQSERESSFLSGLLGRDGLAAFNPGRFWLDATDLISEGDWVWAGNEEHVDSTMAHWAPGEPSDTNHAEHCLALDFTKGLMWTDEDCELKNNFICEFQ